MDDARIVVDRELCVGSSVCVSLAPEVMEVDAEGMAQVITTAMVPIDLADELAGSCPTGALALEPW